MHPEDSFLAKRRSIYRVGTQTQCGSRCSLTTLLVKQELVHLCFILLSSLCSIKTIFVLKTLQNLNLLKVLKFVLRLSNRPWWSFPLCAIGAWSFFFTRPRDVSFSGHLGTPSVMVTLVRGNFAVQQPPDYAGRRRSSRRARQWSSASP